MKNTTETPACLHDGHYTAISTSMVATGSEITLIHSVLCGACGAVFNPITKLKMNLKSPILS